LLKNKLYPIGTILKKGKMSKILAIKGDEERGNEVIALLEMLGGDNRDTQCRGIEVDFYYYIDTYGRINYEDCFIEDEAEFFTLDEFYKKYPFKVGDLVDRNIDYVSCIIDDMRWNSEKCCVEYHLNYLNGSEYGWHVSDCLIKPENVDVIIGTKIESTGFMQMGKTVSVIFNSENYEDEVELQLGDYEIEVRDGKTYAVKKKTIYPKTYEECYDESNTELHFIYVDKDERDLFERFIELRRCYKAYLKIADNWQPDWTDDKQTKYMITYFNGNIEFFTSLHSYVVGRRNHILAFPTEEMRSAFFDNFKDLIELCKELL
jgi:hypothetical protein